MNLFAELALGFLNLIDTNNFYKSVFTKLVSDGENKFSQFVGLLVQRLDGFRYFWELLR